jgi:hypothetical protein
LRRRNCRWRINGYSWVAQRIDVAVIATDVDDAVDNCRGRFDTAVGCKTPNQRAVSCVYSDHVAVVIVPEHPNVNNPVCYGRRRLYSSAATPLPDNLAAGRVQIKGGSLCLIQHRQRHRRLLRMNAFCRLCCRSRGDCRWKPWYWRIRCALSRG